jgi:hypothetical protein
VSIFGSNRRRANECFVFEPAGRGLLGNERGCRGVDDDEGDVGSS